LYDVYSLVSFETAVVVPAAMPALIIVPHETEGDDGLMDAGDFTDVNQLETVAVEEHLPDHDLLILGDLLLVHHRVVELHGGLPINV